MMRWHAYYRTGGTGHLHEGRFKSFPVQCDEHLVTLLRYVERNAVRAGLAKRVEDWRWGSACRRRGRAGSDDLLADWPADRRRSLFFSRESAGLLTGALISS